MKFDVAVITTEGETEDLPLPVTMEKIKEVAAGKVHFSAYEDEVIAKWMLHISKILILR